MIHISVELIGILLGLIVIWISLSLYSKRHIFKFSKKFKGYKFYPVIGNFLKLWERNFFRTHIITTKELGLPCGLWFGHSYYYLTDDLDDIKVILNHSASLDKGQLYDQFKIAFGDCLLLAPGGIWKDRRKFFSRSFHQSILNGFIHYFYQNSTILLNSLRDFEGKDLFHTMGRYTFDSFCDAFLGRNYSLQTNKNNKFIEYLDELQTFAGNNFLIAVSFYFPMQLVSVVHYGLSLLKKLWDLRSFTYRAVRNKRMELEVSPVVDTKLSFVDAMLSEKENMFSSLMIQNEVFLFATAATDTIANTSSFTMTLLAIHPEIQEKVYEEVMTEIGRDKSIDGDDLNKLKYTERVLFESMRLVPAIPIVARYTTEDVQVGNKIIPKGVNVCISVFCLHRNEKYWPDPLKFDPDRFLPEEVAKRNPYCFIPFSTGSRNCIGKNYALLSLKVVIANIIRNFKITTSYKSIQELELRSYVTMRANHRLDLHFSPRN